MPRSYRSAEGGPASGEEGEDVLVFEDDVVLPTMSPARPSTGEVASLPAVDANVSQDGPSLIALDDVG